MLSVRDSRRPRSTETFSSSSSASQRSRERHQRPSPAGAADHPEPAPVRIESHASARAADARACRSRGRGPGRPGSVCTPARHSGRSRHDPGAGRRGLANALRRGTFPAPVRSRDTKPCMADMRPRHPTTSYRTSAPHDPGSRQLRLPSPGTWSRCWRRWVPGPRWCATTSAPSRRSSGGLPSASSFLPDPVRRAKRASAPSWCGPWVRGRRSWGSAWDTRPSERRSGAQPSGPGASCMARPHPSATTACGVFQGLPSPMTVARYHSLVTDPAALPSELEAGGLDRSSRRRG